MKIIQNPSKLFSFVLPKPEVKIGNYVPSVYNFIQEYEHTVLFNTLTRCFACIDDQENFLLKQDVITVNDINCDPVIKNLIELRFLVPEGLEEMALYEEVYETQYLMMQKTGIRLYKILTTTACNARCFYCFEQGIEVATMDDNTTDALFDYIMKTKKEGTVKLYWFGGEPLCNSRSIYRICELLREAGVLYSSDIVTNGSLFTPQMVRDAAELWNLKTCQITLDGMKEEYERRKNYKGNFPNAFETVIENIRLLLDAGVRVQIRMNLDIKNIDSILQLKDFLKEQFGHYPNVTIYPAMIYEDWFGYTDERSKEQRALLLDAWEHTKDIIDAEGLRSKSRLDTSLPMWHCMANSPYSVVVDPKGRLFTCQNYDDKMCYGDIWNGVTNQEIYYAWKHNGTPEEKCRNCVLLPECTSFHKCPTVHHNCYAQRKDRLERKLKSAFIKYQEDETKDNCDEAIDNVD